MFEPDDPDLFYPDPLSYLDSTPVRPKRTSHWFAPPTERKKRDHG
jgi:hypothetical protein